MRKLAKGAIAGGALTVLGVALSSAPMLASASCDGQECNPSAEDWGCTTADGGSLCREGDMLDDNTWESTPENADWLNYPASVTLRLHTACWTGNRQPEDEKIWIAFAPSDGTLDPFPEADPPGAPVGAATIASGNDGTVVINSPGLVEVENGTCAPYVARVLIYFAPSDGGLTPEMMGPCMKKPAVVMDASHTDAD